MADVVDRVTDIMLMLGINNLAFLMLLVGAAFFIPEPIDAVAAEIDFATHPMTYASAQFSDLQLGSTR